MQNVILHEGYVPAYQASSVPFVTSSQISLGEVHTYTFNQVTRYFNIKNRGPTTSDTIAVAFTLNRFNTGNYFTLEEGEAFRDEIRCVQLFVSCSNGSGVNYEIVAGLTNIPYKNFLPITGSNGHQGVG